MPRNHHRPGSSAGNTFSRREVDAIVQLFERLHQRADVEVILKTEPIRSLNAKFLRMKGKLDSINEGLDE